MQWKEMGTNDFATLWKAEVEDGSFVFAVTRKGEKPSTTVQPLRHETYARLRFKRGLPQPQRKGKEKDQES